MSTSELWQAFWEGWDAEHWDKDPYPDSSKSSMWYMGYNMKRQVQEEVEDRVDE